MTTQIPKIIHYCWFGGNPLPSIAEKCIDSWKKHCPDYQIIRWDENNFDIELNQFVKEAYECKKYAFVSDYVRLYVLYNYGGIYMDTDVEILKPIDTFLNNKAFSGFEDDNSIPTGIMACTKYHTFFDKLLSYYYKRKFILDDGTYDVTTNVKIITDLCKKEGFIPNNKKQTVLDFTLYPKDYFCPKNYETGKIQLTENSYAIHHFNGSWLEKKQKMLIKLYHIFGKKYGLLIYRIIINLLSPKKSIYKIYLRIKKWGSLDKKTRM